MDNNIFDLAGRVIIVTGASSGIGLHLCRMLAERGAKVIAASRSAPENTTLAELASTTDLHLCPVRMDVSSHSSVDTTVQQLIRQYGRIDVVINNAGTTSETSLADTPPEEWNRVLETNLSSAFFLSRAVAKVMINAGHGSIINISSIASIRAVNNTGAYGASKAGLNQLTKNLAREMARYGIRANAILPGYIRTTMTKDFLNSARGQKLEKSLPMRRVGIPSDLDGAIVFLASDASTYVTGACIPVDGGYLL